MAFFGGVEGGKHERTLFDGRVLSNRTTSLSVIANMKIGTGGLGKLYRGKGQVAFFWGGGGAGREGNMREHCLMGGCSPIGQPASQLLQT